MNSLGILGAGSFGTALAVHAAGVAADVVLWARRPELAEELAGERVNAEYLPGVTLPPVVRPTAEVAEVAACEAVIVSVPSHGFREALRPLLAARREDAPLPLISAAKGIEVETLARMSRVAREESEASGKPVRFAVLSGPSFAAELGRGLATVSVVASEDPGLAQWLREELSSPSFRLYSSSDVVGVELGGAAKNVIAIAAGVVTGLGLGHNALAALITRGLHEITRLGVASGGTPQTFSGLAGLGDLVVTCTGGLSRNRRTGVQLAQGETLEQITAGTSMVAEGIRTSKAVARLAERRKVAMPITEQVVELLYEGKDARRALEELMTRELKWEAKL